jgi:hypothetical protein
MKTTKPKFQSIDEYIAACPEQAQNYGVAQCKRLVGTLGGDLDIKSESGGANRGTTVTFTIPKLS